MGENALVEMPFTVTVNSVSADLMRVRAPPYDLKAEGFSIIQSGTAEVVTAEAPCFRAISCPKALWERWFRGGFPPDLGPRGLGCIGARGDQRLLGGADRSTHHPALPRRAL